MTSTLQTLKSELSTLPALIAEASKRRDSSAVRRLRERQAELPADIQNAELGVLEAQIAALDAAEKPLALAARSTAAKVAEVQSQRQQVMALCSATEATANVAWNSWNNNRAERSRLATELRLGLALQEGALAGEPLQVSESFFAGLGPFRPAPPTTPPRGDELYSAPFPEQRQAENKRKQGERGKYTTVAQQGEPRAWESRRKGREYYYKKRRVGGAVVSEYIGAGLLGELTKRADKQARQKAEVQRQAWQEVNRREEAIDRQIDEVGAQVQALVDAALLVSGYHQHRRQWRKQRG
jgi:hypothetical protein